MFKNLTLYRIDAQTMGVQALADKYNVGYRRMQAFLALHGIKTRTHITLSPKKSITIKQPPPPGRRLLAPPRRDGIQQPKPRIDAQITWPETVEVQRFGYAPHRYSSTVFTPVTARGIYTGKELGHRSRA